MTKQQENVFEDIVAEMFGDRVTELGREEGSMIDCRPFSNDFQIADDGSFVQQISSGEIFQPAICKREYYYVLPIGIGGKLIIYPAIELVFKAFTSKQYQEDLKKEQYTLKFLDGWKLNPSIDNIEVQFERE
jgi:hypothetical protein